MNIALRGGLPTVERDVGAPPNRVWDILVDLDAWPQWGPTVAGAKLTDTGRLVLGSRGKIRLPLGVWLPFEVTEFEEGRFWAWEVAGVRATRHEVRPAEGGCRVAFAVPLWAPAYLPVCAIALERIARMAR
jgi:Polyketide cyclase / dehydrase and lipid transport